MKDKDKIYNKKRKEILEEIDQGYQPPNIRLGMYDLTPYYASIDFDSSLTEKILLNKNEKRKVHHLREDLYFSPPQIKAYKEIQNHNRIILSAPTSFGKTMLVKEYIFLTKPENVVYIVPTNALAYELERSFKKNEYFSDYLIYDKCSSIQPFQDERKRLFVGTQEKYLELDRDELGPIDLFIIDEAYKLKDTVRNQRSYKLSRAFLDSVNTQARKIVLLTPTAVLNGFDRYDFYIYRSDFNVVDKKYVVIEGNEFYYKLLEKGQTEKTILFCETPEKINMAYENIRQLLQEEKNSDFAEILEREVHPEWSVVKLLKAGILTHHGQMPKYIQNRMLKLFNESKEYNILFGTNSISEGINTVTKNLFIHPDYAHKEDKDILLLKNTVGRAGRLGKYPIGYIYTDCRIEEQIEPEVTITLAISDETEREEITDSLNTEKIASVSTRYQIDYEVCHDIIRKNNISLKNLENILIALNKDRRFPGISNLPFIAKDGMGDGYYSPYNDTVLIKTYLNNGYNNDGQYVYFNTFSDRVLYIQEQQGGDITKIINQYMRFIYSTLEYVIMPVVNIGLEIRDRCQNFCFGNNVLESIEECKTKYNFRTYGTLRFDELSDMRKKIISAMKDYGMVNHIKDVDEEKLGEIEMCLGSRYSTFDVLNAIKRLSKESVSENNKKFYSQLVHQYMI